MSHHHHAAPNSSPAMLHPTHLEQRYAGSVLNNAKFNKGTAFTVEERNKLKLRGLLPPTIESLERQMKRVKEQFDSFTKPIDKYVYLASLKERNETLFYAFTIAYMDQAMPIIYTPTVGEACIRLSHNYRVAEGMYFSRSDKGVMRSMLDNWRLSDVAIIVVTDGSRILGLGDLGANGMGIPVGKLSLYVAAAGFHPALTLPVMLDLGTNNEALLADDLYIGQRHNRLGSEEYYSLVDEFLMAVKDKWPRCLVQFEDFSNDHCFELLDKYRNKMLCFNDDIQGTGAVVGSGFLNAVKLSGTPIRQHRIVFYGAGSAGVGVANQIADLLVQESGCTVEEARQQFWFVDSRGLVTINRGDKLESHKMNFARKDIAADGQLKNLIDVIKHVKPTALVGLSGQGGAFNTEILLEHFKHSQHPIVFPLSNPTKNSECTAKDAYTLSEGRCLFASGSPFDPVEYNGHTYYPGQGNNMYIFPGLGFGAWLCQAKTVTDEMITAASRTLANCTSPDDLAQGRMYPPISRIRDISAVIAARVMETAFKQGVAQIPKPDDALTFVRANMWWPEYRPIEEAKL